VFGKNLIIDRLRLKVLVEQQSDIEITRREDEKEKLEDKRIEKGDMNTGNRLERGADARR
jgi:hypothetical protein